MKPWKTINLTDPITSQAVRVFRLEVFGTVLIYSRVYPNEKGGVDRLIAITSRSEPEG